MNTKISARTFAIIDGPDENSVFEAFKHARDKDAKVDINFKVLVAQSPISGARYAKIEDLRIRGIKYDSLSPRVSGGFIELVGECKAYLGVNKHYKGRCYDCYEFNAYYNPECGTGDITFTPDLRTYI